MPPFKSVQELGQLQQTFFSFMTGASIAGIQAAQQTSLLGRLQTQNLPHATSPLVQISVVLVKILTSGAILK